MRAKRHMRELARLAALQRLALDEQRHELGRRCAEADTSQRACAAAQTDCETALGRLDAVLAAPRLCLDDLAIAALRLQGAESTLDEAQRASRTADEAEHRARGEFAGTEYRQHLLGRMAREIRRKDLEKSEAAAITEAVAIGIARERR